MTRRRGRPKLDTSDTTSHVSLSLPSRELDALCRVALRHDVSVSEVIRRKLKLAETRDRQRGQE